MKTNTALKRRSLKNVLDHLLGVVSVILIFLSLTGCATTNAKPEALSPERGTLLPSELMSGARDVVTF